MERAKRRTANSAAWRLPTASRKMARPSVSYFARNFRETPTAETYIGDFSSRPRFHSKLARSKRYANSRLKENTKRNEYDGRLVEKDLQQKEIKSYKINLEFLIYNNFELKISRGGAQVERNGGVTTLLKTNSEMQKGNWEQYYTYTYVYFQAAAKTRIRVHIGVRIRGRNFRWMSRVRQMPSTKGSATKGAANRRSYLESRRNSSAGKQCKYRFAGYSFFLRHARSRTRRDLPASCVFLLSAPVSASVLCNFPSRRFDECLRRDLEPLINPRARAWRRDGPSLNKLAAHRAIN